ncbi:MAG: glycosyl hydrolase family 18 protein [Actinomycetota bacterium]|nr:glycosyl hydrolase family 18 protein [Actinomycetota bacterium]
MSAETFVNYWIGQEPTPPSPALSQMPAYVDVVPLAFVTIDASWQLDFDFLCTTNPPDVIQGWIKEVRANGTRVLFSINDQRIAEVPDVAAFVANVVENVQLWGVDGVDIDFEPPSPEKRLLEVTSALRKALRQALGRNPVLTAPIYAPWIDYPDFLKAFATQLDFVTTMDYTPYPGLDETISLFDDYASAIGTPEKVAIGMSCMGPPDSGNFTPLDDVAKLCRWEPGNGRKQGAMLYTFSYDVRTRAGSGTGYPDGAFTKTIHENLP